MADTNIDDLVLVCDCGAAAAKVVRDALARVPWPEHCDRPMRLANKTDRDGVAIARAKALHPSNGGAA